MKIEFKKGQKPTLDSLDKFKIVGVDLSKHYDKSYIRETGVMYAIFTKEVTINITVEVSE